jgi:hypothetical protein
LNPSHVETINVQIYHTLEIVTMALPYAPVAMGAQALFHNVFLPFGIEHIYAVHPACYSLFLALVARVFIAPTPRAMVSTESAFNTLATETS